MAGEFEVIQNYFTQLNSRLPAGDLGIGDDGAVLSLPGCEDSQLVVVTDTLVSGIHFPENSSAYDIAWKALAVNLSDLAAMGATPWCYSMALSIPKSMVCDAWFEGFKQGFQDLCQQLNLQIPLVGGDTTSTHEGALSVTVSAKGLVKKGQAIFRSGAQMGDLILVTGQIGEGALGLKVAFGQSEVDHLHPQQKIDAMQALNRPYPQTHLGMKLSPWVNSAIDISDGFLQDLSHILRQSATGASSVSSDSLYSVRPALFGAKLELAKLPISAGMQAYLSMSHDWSAVLTGGDDYQLCLTVAKHNLKEILSVAQSLGVKLSVVGEVINRPGIELIFDDESKHYDLQEIGNKAFGFQHF